MLARLINTQALLPLVAQRLGVETGALVALNAVAQRDLAPIAGPGFALMPVITDITKGDFSAVRGLYDAFIADHEMRPATAAAIASWIKANDTDGVMLKVMGQLAELPLLHLDQDFGSVEEFFLNGLFPLMETALQPSTVCSCGGRLHVVAESLVQCDECGLFGDTTYGTASRLQAG